MLVEMTEKHKNEWYLHLPWVLLSRQVALLPDVGTSWAKLCTGCDPVFPGRLFGDAPIVTSSDLKGLVKHLEMEDDKTHTTTSNHPKPTCQNPLKLARTSTMSKRTILQALIQLLRPPSHSGKTFPFNSESQDGHFEVRHC